MFAKWLGRKRSPRQVEIADLAPLATFAHAKRADLATLAMSARWIDIRPGVVDSALPDDQCLFLKRGSIQIQTATGYLLHLHADTAHARYPLPSHSAVVSLFAAEPCTLLAVAGPADKETKHQEIKPSRPNLTKDESEALTQLTKYFQTQHCELPSLPDLALKIGKAIDDPNNGNADIARMIQLDPALSARVVSVVNSAAFGGIQKITSIQHATTRLGRHKIRSLVYSCLLKSIFKISSESLKTRMEELWQHAVHVAALAYVLGRETPGIDPEQALLAGLIHDIGAVAVIGGINRYPILARRKVVLDYAIDSLRMDAGALTLKQWRLEEAFGDVVRHAFDWYRTGSAIPESIDVVLLARLHALVGTPGQDERPFIDAIPAYGKLARGELTPGHSLRLLDEAEADIREVRALIGGD